MEEERNLRRLHFFNRFLHSFGWNRYIWSIHHESSFRADDPEDGVPSQLRHSSSLHSGTSPRLFRDSRRVLRTRPIFYHRILGLFVCFVEQSQRPLLRTPDSVDRAGFGRENPS